MGEYYGTGLPATHTAPLQAEDSQLTGVVCWVASHQPNHCTCSEDSLPLKSWKRMRHFPTIIET